MSRLTWSKLSGSSAITAPSERDKKEKRTKRKEQNPTRADILKNEERRGEDGEELGTSTVHRWMVRLQALKERTTHFRTSRSEKKGFFSDYRCSSARLNETR